MRRTPRGGSESWFTLDDPFFLDEMKVGKERRKQKFEERGSPFSRGREDVSRERVEFGRERESFRREWGSWIKNV